ncbi:uncharacterized protein LOC127735882 isoform X2 [Mytilus californianus]|uniref:uncharacterized protein LOC127735882 isoform X2 n=1 Tax=Mytilus californianus TaxID=6549 RepID=UPI0022461E59|nr:uncharacterized protein LOC127735882 isoform X2 [Mytilus californianus]
MPSKTPKKGNTASQKRSPGTPKSPGWVSGRDAVFISPKSLSPKIANKRRTSVYQKDITKDTQQRTRRRTSVYQNNLTKDTQQRTNRRTSVYQKPKDVQPKQVTNKASEPIKQPTRRVRNRSPVIKPPTRRVRNRSPVETEVFINVKKQVIQSPVVSLVDVISPGKMPSHQNSPVINKSKSEGTVRTPSTAKKSQGITQLQKSVSATQSFKTPKQHVSSSKKSSVRKSSRKTSTKKLSPNESKQILVVRNTPATAKKGSVAITDEESLLITFKTPAPLGSISRSARKRKAVEKISPPAKKCILDLSPVEKVPFKTPYKLDKSPVLLLRRTPLTDVFTSTPREIQPSNTPLKPSISTLGRKSLKRSRHTLSKTKKVSIVSDLKTPDSNRRSLTARRKGTPAKVSIENRESSSNVTSLGDSQGNQTITSIGNTTSHSSAGRCTIL